MFFYRKLFMRISALFLACTLIFSLCACSGKSAKTGGIHFAPSEEDEAIQMGPELEGEDFSEFRIGVSLPDCTSNTYHVSYVQALNSYISELGVEATVFDAFGDEGQQAAQIKTLISMAVDLIILWPVNSDTAVNWVRSVDEAGIPVIMANTNVAPEGEAYSKAFVGPSGINEAYETANKMIADLSGSGNIVVINGQDNYEPVKERRSGLSKACSGSRVNIIEEYNNGGDRSIARTYMEECLRNHNIGEIDAVFCYDDESGMGAFDAMKNLNRTNEIRIYVAATGNYDAVSYISDGTISATAIQSPIVDAKTTLGYALWYLLGNKLDDYYYYIETPVITPENIDSLNITSWE